MDKMEGQRKGGRVKDIPPLPLPPTPPPHPTPRVWYRALVGRILGCRYQSLFDTPVPNKGVRPHATLAIALRPCSRRGTLYRPKRLEDGLVALERTQSARERGAP